uniref:ZP domain-containing protein n=1 Tax=Arion vulgaris TaxID=1028688 RepID=A0A0B7B4G8_9EUPU
MAYSCVHTYVILFLVFTSSCTGQTNSTEQSSPTSPATSTGGSNFSFDCRRGTNSCGSGGTCNLQTGKCDCGGNGTVSYNCVDETPDASDACVPACINGVCHGQACVCDETYYGATCNLDRAQVICENETMFVNINPIDNFKGLIYVRDNTNCFLSYNTIPATGNDTAIGDGPNTPGMTGWSRTFPSTDSNCAGIPTSIANFVVQFYIQYSSVFKSAVDQIVTARCGAMSSNFTVSSQVIGVTDSDNSLTQVDTGDKADTVTLAILRNDRQPVTGAVLLGEVILLYFSMALNYESVNTDFKLLSCVANNTKFGLDLLSLDFLTNGCPTQDGQVVYNGLPSKQKNTTTVSITVPIKTFMFLESANVAFLCVVSFCNKNDNNGNCQPDPCTGFSNNDAPASSISDLNNGITPDNSTNTTSTIPRRKKRASPDDNRTVQNTITVVDPNAKDNTVTTPTARSAKTEDCILNPDIIAVIAILGVCVFWLLVIAAFLIFRIQKTKKKPIPSRSNEMPYPVETMRFPRLELNTTHHDGC